MKDFIKSHVPNEVYSKISRRSFLKGALAVGGALALSGCGETVTNTVTVTDTKTVTVTDTKTVVNTVTNTVTVTESAPVVPETPAEVQPMVVAPAYIIPQYTRCVGCNLCMQACSFEHCGDLKMGASNIQVYGIDIKGGMVDIPVLCMHCPDAPCMAACPPKVNAIYKDELTGAMKINHDLCTLCELCVEACAEQKTGCLRIDEADQKVVGMCDLCEGNPQCVQICPEDCLMLIMNSTAAHARYAQKPEEIAKQVWNLLYRV